jgi:mitochondrial import inner membrane translocase subunit TIM54
LSAKLPSRNWLIFFTVVGSFTAAITYDRRAKKRAQQRWCNAVSPLSKQLLEPMGLPRRLTVYLAAPPGDGLRPSREFFQEYVKPILVAGAVDWEVVEARREGDIRAKLAERIRRYRRKMGEAELKEGEEDIIWDIRQGQGIKPVDDRGGDLVIGRHAWKEYVRGLHEGWLGPVRDPAEVEEEKKQAEAKVQAESQPVTSLEAITGPDNTDDVLDTATTDDASPTTSKPNSSNDETAKKDTPKPKPGPDPALILSAAYPSATLPPSTPELFPPTVCIAQPHILGFFNTPIRTYRYLTRRRLADATGAQVATLLLAPDARSFTPPSNNSQEFASEDPASAAQDSDASSSPATAASEWEQQRLLAAEENEWHKSVRAPRGEGVEAVWTDPMVLDPRIAQRMRTPVATMPGSALYNTESETFTGVEGVSSHAPDDGSAVRGNARDWKGGADRGRVLGWWSWLVEATGFADDREPRGEYVGHGLVGDQDE